MSTRGGVMTTTTQIAAKSNMEWESKLASLEKTITELRNENETLKVSACITFAW